MKALRHEAPAPAVLRARLQEQAGLAEPPLAVVFASAYRKHVGKTLLLRALEPLPPAGRSAAAPPGQLTPADPRDSHHLDEVPEGAIVSAVKADHLAAGKLATADALHDAPAWHRPQPRDSAPGARRRPRSATASSSPARSARSPRATARSTRRQDPATGGALVGAQGPLHLRVLRQRLKEVFGMDVEEVAAEPGLPRDHQQEPGDRLPPQEADRRRRPVRRRQADRRARRARRRLRLRRGGQGRRGAAELHPRRRGRAPATRMDRGPLGFPVVDVSVTLTDGQAHSVDSSDMAFRIAGRQGTREALKAAGPVLLQPIYRIAIHAPSMFTGSLGPIVASHSGQVLGFDADPDAKGWEIYEALVPGSALEGFANDVRAATQGRRLLRGRLRPLRGAARQGRRAHRPGARPRARVKQRSGVRRGAQIWIARAQFPVSL